MNVADWREKESLVSWLIEVQGHHNWAMLMEAIENTHPRREIPRHGMSDTDCVRKLGISEGFDMAIDMLKVAATPAPSSMSVESTFGADEGKEDNG